MKLNTLALATVLGLGSLTVTAAELPDGPHIVTSGSASVDAAPDMATLSIEVNVSAKDAVSAKKQADSRVAQYMTFLQQNNVAKKDINAANLRTRPEYDYLKDGKSQLKGYLAVRSVDVTVRQLNKLNELLDGALKAGLNDIRTVTLGVADPKQYKEMARKAAIDDAMQQAKEVAKGFHATLGPVYSIRYHVSSYQSAPVARLMKADAASDYAAETYEQQTLQFNDQVDVVYQLANAQPPRAQ